MAAGNPSDSPLMRQRAGVIPDAVLALAIGGLLAVLGGRVLLLSWGPSALQAHTLLAPSAAARGEPAHLVLVIDRDEHRMAARADTQVRRNNPGQRLEVVRAPWPVTWRHRSREARIARLVRAYGYSELPVLLTVSREGHIVRVQPFPPTPEP